MGKKILIIPDQHAHPDHHNDRALWAGKFIFDTKPDIVVNMGDGADMPSLCSYDKGKRSFHGRSYARDIESHHDFEEKLWSRHKLSKKKRPHKVALIGNHDYRVEKALDISPELEGTLSLNDLAYKEFYDEVVPYNGALPGTVEIEGITFAHYLTSGIMGRPIGGERAAGNLITKQLKSCVVAHSHTTDYAVRTSATGKRIQALVAGVYQDYEAGWCGRQVQQLWWAGVIVLHNAEEGSFDPQWISMDTLRKEYVQ